jgi:C-terminal processing protease CtpA/Prc
VKTTTAVSIPFLLCAAVLLSPARDAAAQGNPPPPPPPPPAVAPRDNSDLDAQLEAARRQLEAAAHQIAALSAQMSQPWIEKFAAFGAEPGRAILGVQLDGAAPGGGARVSEVSPGGPAAEAGIRAGDVIIAVNGTTLSGDQPAHQVMDLMREVKPDSKVTVRVQRDGKPRDFTVTARGGPLFMADDDMKRFEIGPMAPMPGPRMMTGPLADMELVTLTPQLGRYFGADKGVLVVRAPADGTLKLEDGDVILAIDGRSPTSGSHATRILASYQPGEKLALRVIRDHKTLELQATMPERGMHETRGRERPTLRGAVVLPDPGVEVRPRVIAIAPYGDET